MRVYLAGKISKNDWRHQIFAGLREYDYDRIHGDYLEDLDEEREPLREWDIEYGGPYFISDDRGGFHGEGMHGRGVGRKESPLPQVKIDRAGQVVRRCFEWIKSSDVFFCWLDAEDAYGTIVELGYAAALNKRIFMAIDKKLVGSKFLKDCWFARETADNVVYTNHAREAWDIFVFQNEVQQKEIFSYLTDSKSLNMLNTKINEFCNSITRGAHGGARSADELNSLDRFELTERCIDTMNLRTRFADLCEQKFFLTDLALEIDFRLVRGFYRNRDSLTTSELNHWRIEGTGLEYQFSENYARERKREEIKAAFQPRITEKQIELVTRLLVKSQKKLSVPTHTLTIEQAGELISHFLHGEHLSAETAALLEELHETEIPPHLIHCYKASEVVERVQDALSPLGLKFNMPVHTKCAKYYHVQEEANEFCRYESDLKYPSYRYSQKWVDLLIQDISVPEKYEEVVKGT